MNSRQSRRAFLAGASLLALTATVRASTLWLTSAPPLNLIGSPVLTGQVGSPYAGFTVLASGGTPPYVYTVQSGALPTPTTLNSSTGVVSQDVLTVGGTFSAVLLVTDAHGLTDTLPTGNIVIQSSPSVPSVANQTLTFGALTIAGAGKGYPVNTGGVITIPPVITGGTANDGHWTRSSDGGFARDVNGKTTPVPSGTLVCNFANGNGTQTGVTITISSVASAYSIVPDGSAATTNGSGQAELRAAIGTSGQNGIANCANTTFYYRPGTENLPPDVWALQQGAGGQIAATCTLASHPEQVSNGTQATLLMARQGVRTCLIRNPKNIKFANLNISANFVPGWHVPSTQNPMQISGEAGGMTYDTCAVFGTPSYYQAATGVGVTKAVNPLFMGPVANGVVDLTGTINVSGNMVTPVSGFTASQVWPGDTLAISGTKYMVSVITGSTFTILVQGTGAVPSLTLTGSAATITHENQFTGFFGMITYNSSSVTLAGGALTIQNCSFSDALKFISLPNCGNGNTITLTKNVFTNFLSQCFSAAAVTGTGHFVGSWNDMSEPFYAFVSPNTNQKHNDFVAVFGGGSTIGAVAINDGLIEIYGNRLVASRASPLYNDTAIQALWPSVTQSTIDFLMQSIFIQAEVGAVIPGLSGTTSCYVKYTNAHTFGNLVVTGTALAVKLYSGSGCEIINNTCAFSSEYALGLTTGFPSISVESNGGNANLCSTSGSAVTLAAPSGVYQLTTAMLVIGDLVNINSAGFIYTVTGITGGANTTDFTVTPAPGTLAAGTSIQMQNVPTGNVMADNCSLLNTIDGVGANTNANNYVVDSSAGGATGYAASFALSGGAWNPTSIATAMTIYAAKGGGQLDTAVPKAGCLANGGAAYVDFTNRIWDLPRKNPCTTFTIANLTGQAVGTLLSSAATQILGILNSAAAASGNGALVQVSGGSGSPQFKITTDAGGSSIVTNWTSTPAIIMTNQYLFVRDTSSPSHTTMTTVAVQVGSNTVNWSITTS